MRLALAAAALVALAGCRETQHCGTNMSYQNGSCMPLSTSDGGPRDGGGDANADSGRDAGPDAGPCQGSCGGTTPHCPEASPDGGTTDAGTLPMCVQCVSDGDCSRQTVDGGVLICRGYVCAPGCDTAADCGGNVCRADRTCSSYRPNREFCEACDTDANCMAGGGCVHFDNGGHPGEYCLANLAAFGACLGRRRYTTTVTGLSTVDGATATDYCVPSNGTTCEAVLAAGNSCASSGCPATAMCPAATCTYECDTSHGNNDCPAGHTCPSATSLCL